MAQDLYQNYQLKK